MSASIVDDESRVLDLISAYAAQKDGQRGIETYLWIVAMLRDAANAHSYAVIGDSASGVVTTSAGSAVLHCLQGDLANAGEVIESARTHFREVKFRGLALPGDRLTKNLFEEARMPAQMLLH